MNSVRANFYKSIIKYFFTNYQTFVGEVALLAGVEEDWSSCLAWAVLAVSLLSTQFVATTLGLFFSLVPSSNAMILQTVHFLHYQFFFLYKNSKNQSSNYDKIANFSSLTHQWFFWCPQVSLLLED